ncbi:MAG: hypothetical protein N2C14_18935 [Planctomycetales bacterium]
MIAPVNKPSPVSNSSVPVWHSQFTDMLPSIVKVARFAFREFDEEACEEAVQEVVCNCLVGFVRLVERGREDRAFPSALARYAIRQYCAGRRVGTPLNVKDVSSRHCQLMKGFSMEGMYERDKKTSRWVPFVVGDHRTPVADQAAFRLDFPAWLATLSVRNRDVAEEMAVGETTTNLARRFRISPARVSQLRKEFKESWDQFHLPQDEKSA